MYHLHILVVKHIKYIYIYNWSDNRWRDSSQYLPSNLPTHTPILTDAHTSMVHVTSFSSHIAWGKVTFHGQRPPKQGSTPPPVRFSSIQRLTSRSKSSTANSLSERPNPASLSRNSFRFGGSFARTFAGPPPWPWRSASIIKSISTLVNRVHSSSPSRRPLKGPAGYSAGERLTIS